MERKQKALENPRVKNLRDLSERTKQDKLQFHNVFYIVPKRE
jgi:hypothetical protein